MLSIRDIESLPEEKAVKDALEHLVIKEHEVYLIDLGDAFGYSALVYKNGKPIHYANDYELHHSKRSRGELRNIYVEGLNNKLFTEEELTGPVKGYDDYQRKSYYLHNYYGMRYDNVSMFFIVTPESEAAHNEAIKGLFFNPVSYSYMADKEAVEHMADLQKRLSDRRKECEQSYEYLKSAFKYEMSNHEYAINTYQGNWDVLSCFGEITYNEFDDINDYFDQLKFTDVQKKAFLDARKEYFAECETRQIC